MDYHGKRFRIDPDRCTGCCECIKVCRDRAIRKVTSALCAKCPKYCSAVDPAQLQCSQNKMCIDPRACSQCGACFEVCPHDAVIVEDTVAAPAGAAKAEGIA
mgnify:CR=1 FL=1